MTCGEAYKKIIDAWNAGRSKKDMAAMMNVSTRYVGDVIAMYCKQGERLFNSRRPFKGTKNNIPDEEAIYANHRRNEIIEQAAAREMRAFRDSLRVNDRIVIHRMEGQGFCRIDVATEIKIEYIGRDYVMGKTERGVKESQSIYELWKWAKENEGGKT